VDQPHDGQVNRLERRRSPTTIPSGAKVTADTVAPSIASMRLVESSRGAVSASWLVRFPDPLPEPDVRLPPHPALHEPVVSLRSSWSAHPTAKGSSFLGSGSG
jgi:hypothetical protein